MSSIKFNIGDKVKYKASEAKAAKINLHNPDQVYTVSYQDEDDLVHFSEVDTALACFASRLELVKAAPKKVKKKISKQMTAWGIFDKKTQNLQFIRKTRDAARELCSTNEIVKKIQYTIID